MDNKITELSYSVYSNKGSFALLLGSGVSRPSGIPTGWEITLDLIKQISILEKQKEVNDLETWFQEYFEEKPDYSNILEKLTRTPEERVNALRHYFEPIEGETGDDIKKPTVAHQKIAQLVQDGYVKVIVTTNFDRLIENSLKDLGIEPVVISNPGHVENTIPLIHSRITVVKINGDYLDTKFLNIKSELGEYDARLANLLSFIFENFGLLTCGWSAKWDSALVSILKSSNKFRYSSFFTFTSNSSTELEELCNQRTASLVKIQSADKLFEDLTENIKALENNYAENPLSAKIALARVKKYLTKEEFTISLSDIVHNLTEETYKKLNSINHPYPTGETIKQVIETQFQYLELIIPAIIEGGHWSKQYQSNVWMSAIKRIGSPKELTGTSYSVWTQSTRLPLVTLRYVFGIACLTSENWPLLKTSFEIKFSNRYTRDIETISKVSHLLRVFDPEFIRTAYGQRYYTPMSELLFKELRKYFINLLPDDKDFEDIFDYYEYISCLMFLREYINDYPPIGRFGWRDRQFINHKIAELSKQGDKHELIQTGLISSMDELATLMSKIKETLENTRYY